MGYFHCLAVVNITAVNMDMRICLQDHASFGYIPKSKAHSVKNLPVVQKTQVRSLGWEDPLEKEMANRSNVLAWKIPWVKEPGELQSVGLQRVRHDRATNTFTFQRQNCWIIW